MQKAKDSKAFPIVAVICVTAILSTGMIFGGKETIVEKETVREISQYEQAIKQLEEGEEVGGLVEVFRKVFPEGFVVGSDEEENIFHVDENNKLYIGATSSDSNYAPIEIDIGADPHVVTLRNTNFTTSSLNWNADFSVDRLFYVDQSADGVGFGTTTPEFMVEIANAADAVLALTATSTNDTIIRFNTAGGQQEWIMWMDNSNSDTFNISTTTDAILSISESTGKVTIGEGGLNVATSTFTGAASFGSTLEVGSTLTILGDMTSADFIEGGGVYSTTVEQASFTATAANVCDNNIWKINPYEEALAITLPSTSTLYADCLTANGHSKEILIYNASGTGATAVITITAPAFGEDTGGIELQSDDTSGEIIAAAASGEMKFWRVDAVTTTASVRPFTPAD